MKIDAELFDICKEFINTNKISSKEDLESFEEESLVLLEEICDLIGYYDYEEEEYEEE